MWDQGSQAMGWGSAVFFSRGIRDQHLFAFGIKDQKFGYKNGISDEKKKKTYLVTSLHYRRRYVSQTWEVSRREEYIWGSPRGFREQGNVVIKLLGTREQKENKAVDCLRARVHFAGIAKIGDYSQSGKLGTREQKLCFWFFREQGTE